MQQTTIDYLERYIAELAKVSNESQVYGALSDWHVDTKVDLIAAAQDINADFGLEDATRLQPHIATTAIGRLSGEMVIVSANPGYSDKPVARNPGRASTNALEDAYRSQSKQNNADFCRHFFDRYRQVCGGSSPYWTRVMRFLEAYRGEERAASTEALWAKTYAGAALGGLDLLPLHSRRDGITRHLHGPNADPLLRKVALATLAMALRLAPRFLLITSGPGQALMTELIEQKDESGPLAQANIVARRIDAPAPYDRIRAWDVSMQGGATTTIVSYPYQKFSGAFVAAQVGHDALEFASVLRKLLLPEPGLNS